MESLFSTLPGKSIRFFVLLLITGAMLWMLHARWSEVSAVSIDFSRTLTVLLLLPPLILVVVNWGLEAMKFRILMRAPEAGSLIHMWKAVLAGIAFSMFMPNRMGEVIGRVSCLRKEYRAAGVSAAIAGSGFQMFWTMCFGGIVIFGTGRAVLQAAVIPSYHIWLWPIIGLVLVAILISQFLGGVQHFLKGVWIHMRETLQCRTATFGLLLALMRYATYVLQFALLLLFAGATTPFFNLISFAMMVFFLQSILPLPPALGWLGRLQLAVLVGGLWHIGFSEAVLASLVLWIFNLFLPGFMGAWFWLRTFRLKSTNYAPITQII